ncbi:p53-induced death domain-containing protein 1 [Desmodus rotundus]|uniref:p53-induced death domain-containing protein 1 n=1 Tax=Desmodus rotundus TaxID=9430 RepID=UPI0023816F25|nr:p53-induced death domain-containing protein 1 [Desmodus rotundus]XP_045039154.2 p53-induced death domain-containing protein 1 [Desmodus rotundus]XP_045039155.2 p53-induced death domain-containing protein 1 [Desmodus rotundus]XP_045039156.2 p53-induced death domain-containing protein 1 [Desmodus rotundus]XP_045039157.2 p53-induced death domain-containing protein 1 [Desmodus rotundus]XP_045039158.2 p53-induced death domain-containing protein 1 [Desmodus rotundus]XP_045039159.2 p53-induced de
MAAVEEELEPQVAAAGDAADVVDSDPGAPLLLAGNWLSLDLHPWGCRRLLHLCAQQTPQLREVEFLQLSGHEDPRLLEATLARVPESLPHLRSLIIKGGQHWDAQGTCVRGSLTTLPASLSGLACLAHLDLSFNSLEMLPACVLQMSGLDSLLLSHNRLSELPAALGALSALTFFSATHNRLPTLPPALGALYALQRLDLSENLLDSLPSEIRSLRSLEELNLASNRLQSLPASLAELRSLRFLVLHSNLLASVPAGLAHLPLLARLDLRDNQLREVPPELLDAPFVRLQGNPLGEPLPDPCSPPGSPVAPEMPRLFLTSDFDSFPVTPHGCSVTLACGVRLQFPAGATARSVTIRYRLWLPEPRLVPLGPHDSLLSGVLELQPHGVAFQQEVGLWLLFVPPRSRRCREVVVRTRSEDSWSDLETHLEEETPKRLWAHCQVPHFSWFLVVSRPMSNACLVPPEGTLLWSSGHPGVKVTFPPGATEEPRHVCMQVVRTVGRELQALLQEPEAAASPLLCLSQSSPSSFLRPVTVQLPLPPGVTGLCLDRTRLHLLYRAPPSATWDDITAQVALELTHLYARFQVTHFSWYWLWYTTKTCVGGLAQKAWQRLRLHRVNLIALQRRRDPEQVLLQCLPRNKVDATLRRLLERYQGPEPSDTVEMFEGEKFFAAFERGIDVDADRPDCVQGRMCFVFYSHLKNVKEVYVTTTLDRQAQAVRGQVSFYRGAVPEEVPEEAEAARLRKGADALWMATLPIKLPRLRRSEGPGPGAGLSLAPLNLGDAETGFLTQSNLLNLAGRLGPDWPAVALHLGLPYQELQRIRHEFRHDLDGQIRHMLFSWAERQAGQPGAVGLLVQALEQSDRRDVAEEVRAILELGRHKYQDGIRRTSLAPRDLAPPGPCAPQTPESAQA